MDPIELAAEADDGSSGRVGDGTGKFGKRAKQGSDGSSRAPRCCVFKEIGQRPINLFLYNTKYTLMQC